MIKTRFPMVGFYFFITYVYLSWSFGCALWPQPTERKIHKRIRTDGLQVHCVEPPPDVLVKGSELDIELNIKKIDTALKTSIGGEVEFTKIREIRAGVAEYEIIDFHICQQYANEVLTSQEYWQYTQLALSQLIDLSYKEKGLPALPEKSKEEIITRTTSSFSPVNHQRLLKILWVDDHPDNNDAERNYFAQLGIKIDLATSTTKALDRIDRQQYDLILSDIKRGWNPWAGLQLLKAIRDRHYEIPVVFYTLNYNPSRGIPSGASGVTTRPGELFDLVLKLLK